MAQKAERVESVLADGPGDESAPLDPILAAVRARGLGAFRVMGTMIGVVSLASLAEGVAVVRAFVPGLRRSELL